MLHDRGPDDALRSIFGTPELATDSQDRANGRTDWPLVAADDDDGRRAMAGDVGTRVSATSRRS